MVSKLKTVTYQQANSVDDFKQAKALFEEYIHSIKIDLDFQGIDKELAQLALKYPASQGGIILAYNMQHEAIGCVALHALAPDIAEVKRLYVKPAYRQLAIGKALMDLVIALAQRHAYTRLRLDSLLRFKSAIALYKQYHFYEISPYNDNPIEDVIYLEKRIN